MYYNSKSYFGMELNGVIRDVDRVGIKLECHCLLYLNDNMKKIYK